MSDGDPHDSGTPQAGGIRAFLRARGCEDRIVIGGLEGLIAEWESIAESVEGGYPLDTLDDYLNDMDLRELIEEALAAVRGRHDPRAEAAGALRAAGGAALDVRLASADARMRSALVAARGCLWGEAIGAKRGWSAAREWWYFMRPARPGPELRAELEARGLA
jgi:hypothetical protein